MTYVGVGRRFAALLVDGLVSLVWTIPLSHISTTSNPRSVTIDLAGARGWIAVAIWFLYLTAMEAGIGATFGKLALGIRVVREDGGSIDLGRSLVRNLARTVDGLPWILPYLVGAIVVWNSPTKQRLGDRWAHTVVVVRGSAPWAGTEQLPRTETPIHAGSDWMMLGSTSPPLPPPPDAPTSGDPEG
jgi:uncharacterized RDD family membrane protein YckC